MAASTTLAAATHGPNRACSIRRPALAEKLAADLAMATDRGLELLATLDLLRAEEFLELLPVALSWPNWPPTLTPRSVPRWRGGGSSRGTVVGPPPSAAT